MNELPEVVTVEGKQFKVVKDIISGCSSCIGRNNDYLCESLEMSVPKGCADRKVHFVPVEQQQEDVVNEPKHYQMNIKGYDIEVRDVCKFLANRLSEKGYSGMFISDYIQMIQYLLRFHSKNGEEDLRKASWYLERLIEEYKQDED